MKQSIPLLFASAATIVSPALGWGSRIESVRSATRLSFTKLKAAEDEDDFDAYREKLEATYNSYGAHGETAAGFFDSDYVSQLRDRVHSPLLDSYEELTDEDTMPCGDDCEQCEIPEEFRLTDMDPIDVMAYLQIRRAEPLRVEGTIRRDWE